MKTPRRRDSGVSLGELNYFNNPPSPPFLKVGYRGNPTAKTMGYLKFNKGQVRLTAVNMSIY
jgi:hypothetical protein